MYSNPSPGKKRRRSYKSYLSKTSSYFGKISVQIKELFTNPDGTSFDGHSTDTDAQVSPSGERINRRRNFEEAAFVRSPRGSSSDSQVSLHIQRRHSANDALFRPPTSQQLPAAALLRSQSSFSSNVLDADPGLFARRCATISNPEPEATGASTPDGLYPTQDVYTEPAPPAVRSSSGNFPLERYPSGIVQTSKLQVRCDSSCSRSWDRLVTWHNQAAKQYNALALRLNRIEALLWFQTAALVFAFGTTHLSSWVLLLPGLAAGLWVLRSKPLNVEEIATELSLLPTLLQVETPQPMYSSIKNAPEASPKQPESTFIPAQYPDSKSRTSAEHGNIVGLRQAMAQSPDFPLLVRFTPQLRYQKCLDGTNPWMVPVNCDKPVEFETALFKGRLMFWVANVRSSPKELFKGRQRKSQCVVQGQFKVPLQFADVMSGQSFERPLKNMPSSWLVDAALGVARHIAPSLYVGPSSKPAVLAPLAASAQAIKVSLPGQEPNILGPDYNPEEDMSLVDSCLAGMSAAQRKKYFDSPARRAKYSFSTSHVWTIHFWQHLLDMGSLQLELGPFLQFRLGKSLNGQPLQLMAHSQAHDQYLWGLQVWHDSQVEQALKHGEV